MSFPQNWIIHRPIFLHRTFPHIANVLFRYSDHFECLVRTSHYFSRLYFAIFIPTSSNSSDYRHFHSILIRIFISFYTTSVSSDLKHHFPTLPPLLFIRHFSPDSHNSTRCSTSNITYHVVNHHLIALTQTSTFTCGHHLLWNCIPKS